MSRVVAYGDAIAAGIAFANPPTVNAGVPGRGLVAGAVPPSSMIERGDRVIVSFGWHDVAALFGAQPFFSVAMYERRFFAVLQEIGSRSGRADTVLLGLEPLARPYPGIGNPQVLAMNMLLERIAHKAGAHFLDLAAHPVGWRAEDGLHYQRAGYQQLFARALHLVESGHLLPLRPPKPWQPAHKP